MAEWRALLDPGTDASVAHIKLHWWREEMSRLAANAPLHPISRYLADLAGAAGTHWSPLAHSVEACAAQVAGVPLERAADLGSHANALYGAPLLVAAELAGGGRSAPDCIAALAAAQYLAKGLADYGREARAGRIPFAVEELLAAGIGNDDLAADVPPAHLTTYLNQLRGRAAGSFAIAAAALAPEERPSLRHLLVLATLGAKQLNGPKRRPGADFRLADLYNAWSAARRATAAR